MKKLIVYDIYNLNIRQLNENNYFENLNTGFICFDREIISILKEEYNICGYYMFDNKQQIFIDIMKDKIVFTEGMFNRINKTIKDRITNYNLNLGEQPEFFELCSKFMFNYRLKNKNPYDEKNGPLIMLCFKIENDRFLLDKVLSEKINIYEPINYIEFCNSLNCITKIFDFKIENYDFYDDIKELYLSVLNYRKINFEYNELLEYFYKYLWLVLKEKFGE